MAFDPRHFEDFLHVQAHQGCGCGDVLMANGLEDLLVFNLSISHNMIITNKKKAALLAA